MRILILASGSGTLAQSLIDAQFDIQAIVSDVVDAEVLNRGKKARSEEHTSELQSH